MAKPQASLGNKEEVHFFKEKNGKLGSCYELKVHWSKLGVQSVVASHWLSCCEGLGVGFGGNEEIVSSFCQSSRVVSTGKSKVKLVSSCWVCSC